MPLTNEQKKLSKELHSNSCNTKKNNTVRQNATYCEWQSGLQKDRKNI